MSEIRQMTPALAENLKDPVFLHNFVESLLSIRDTSGRTCIRLERERDEHRRLIIRLFRKLDMTEQLYGEGPEIVTANPWMLQEGPWQSPAEE